jgi:hypothetical protein
VCGKRALLKTDRAFWYFGLAARFVVTRISDVVTLRNARSSFLSYRAGETQRVGLASSSSSPIAVSVTSVAANWRLLEFLSVKD